MLLSATSFTLETIPALVFIAAVVVLMISGGLFLMLLRQQKELEHLHDELYAWRKFGDTVEVIDTPVPAATAPPKPPVRKPRPIPEGLEVIHPAVNR
nr:MAG TPA: hypothetical protein [Caudoviricetes sp.]